MLSIILMVSGLSLLGAVHVRFVLSVIRDHFSTVINTMIARQMLAKGILILRNLKSEDCRRN